MSRRQYTALIFLALAVIGVILLAASLPDLKLQPGLPIPGAETTPQAPAALPSQSPHTETFSPGLLLGVLALAFLGLLFVLVVALARKANKKQVWRILAGMAVLFALLFLIPRAIPTTTSTINEPLNLEAPSFVYHTAPIGNPPPGLFWVVIAALLVCAAVVGGWLLVMAFRRSEEKSSLADEVDAALQAIESGQDLRSVIVCCYLQMESIIKEERNIEREASVTPREFENCLEERGIPKDPIRQLTRLFEKARYDRQEPDDREEQAAFNCLSAIRAACGPGGGGSR